MPRAAFRVPVRALLLSIVRCFAALREVPHTRDLIVQRSGGAAEKDGRRKQRYRVACARLRFCAVSLPASCPAVDFRSLVLADPASLRCSCFPGGDKSGDKGEKKAKTADKDEDKPKASKSDKTDKDKDKSDKDKASACCWIITRLSLLLH
jgi:hypothetical protein